MRYGPRPETSEVRTENYVRRFRDRWFDDDIEIHRGDATGADILDRHDAQFDTLDASCVRTQATYAAGEGAFVINKEGPVRALRDFIGANSGPHVQRQHIFYDAKEVINTYLRVHAVPGVTDFFDYSEAGIGLTYSSGIAGVGAVNQGITIDGVPDPFVPFVGTSGVDGWEAVDGPQGGLTMPQRFVTNNADPTYHGNYRDGIVRRPDLQRRRPDPRRERPAGKQRVREHRRGERGHEAPLLRALDLLRGARARRTGRSAWRRSRTRSS